MLHTGYDSFYVDVFLSVAFWSGYWCVAVKHRMWRGNTILIKGSENVWNLKVEWNMENDWKLFRAYMRNCMVLMLHMGNCMSALHIYEKVGGVSVACDCHQSPPSHMSHHNGDTQAWISLRWHAHADNYYFTNSYIHVMEIDFRLSL